MDKQPLNTGEQKDMTEFFTDLITKMEEMSQELVKIMTSPKKNSTCQDTRAEPDVCLFVAEKHREDSVWRRHHQQCCVSGQSEDIFSPFDDDCGTVSCLLLFLQDCDHVSQTAEEFYTVRCQVADMKNIYVSDCDFGCNER